VVEIKKVMKMDSMAFEKRKWKK